MPHLLPTTIALSMKLGLLFEEPQQATPPVV
jgi:hypothetical protein